MAPQKIVSGDEKSVAEQGRRIVKNLSSANTEVTGSNTHL